MPKVEIFSYIGWPPHTFMGITDQDGHTSYWGFGPAHSYCPIDVGKVSEYTDRLYNISSGPLAISNVEYSALMDYVNQQIILSNNNQLVYDLLNGRECTNWCINGLRAAGLPVLTEMSLGFKTFLDTLAFNPYSQYLGFRVKENLTTLFTASQASIPRRDPLTIDLDGDGIETVPASATNPILFDHDGDGVKTGTRWVKPDDGFLVLDRNGNGAIDNGTELFGDATPLYAGGKAADGFAALSQEDTNGDGRVDSLDANWANLRVWRDLNQDGISQAQELFTMDEAGIVSFNVSSIANSQTLPNGNQIADLGVYTKTDGSTGTMGDVGQLADVNLADDTFHREFPDYIPPAEGVESLPEMKGSGKVRDLHEAASQSASLKDLLTQYSQAATRQAQMALLDQMLDAWADTSGMSESLDDRDPDQYHIRYDSFGGIRRSNNVIGPEGGEYVHDVDNENLTPEYRELIAQWNRKIHILEAFNGRYFFTLPDETQTGFSAVMGLTVDESGGDVGTLLVNYTQDQLNLLNQSYEALRESVYSALLSQTRFKLLMNQIGVVIENGNFSYDYSGVEQYFQDLITQNAAQGMSDLIEFNRYIGNHLSNFGWGGNDIMVNYIRSLSVTPELKTIYDELGVLISGQAGYTNRGSAKSEIIMAGNDGDSIYGNGGNDVIVGGAGTDRISGGDGGDVLYGGDGTDALDGGLGDDTLEGGAGSDYLDAGAGDDVLRGEEGNDNLNGRAGNDTLDGGAGDDNLYGNAGDDVYLYGRGFGNDRIYNSAVSYGGGIDTIQFGDGLTADSFDYFGNSASDLILRIKDAGETLTIDRWFQSADNQVARFRFADGSEMTAADIALRGVTIEGTDESDWLSAFDGYKTVIDAGAGNDSLYGASQGDVLLGGAGNDMLNGYAGNDTLDGGVGG